MIIKKEKKGNIMIYIVEKDFDNNKLSNIMNKKLNNNKGQYFIIEDNADVYTVDNNLLMRFRKNVLKKENITDFYDNVIQFAKTPTHNRGSASGSKHKNINENGNIYTNIIGYFDTLSPNYKKILTQKKIKNFLSVRPTRFLLDYPDKYKKLIPFIKEVDKFYEKLVPDQYIIQRKHANQTHFKIKGTAFTTITTNVNYQTTVHTDKGDDEEGFGNLTVIENGKYSGGETCLPQYGIAVDVRTSDVLYMNVHEAHANLPIHLETPDAIRLSIVCYLRKKIWEKTKGKNKHFFDKHNATFKKIMRS
jgi:hypothetical protein